MKNRELSGNQEISLDFRAILDFNLNPRRKRYMSRLFKLENKSAY